MKRQRGKFRDFLTKEFLHKEHYVNRRSLKSIGNEVGCDHSTVAYYLKLNKLCVHRYDNHGSKMQKHPQWKGHGDISETYWSNLKNGANQRGIEFEIAIEDVWQLYLRQEKKCALTGREIKFESARVKSASLDRIDASKGYELSNVQWLHKDVNYAKQSLSNEEFIELCQEVVKHQKR